MSRFVNVNMLGPTFGPTWVNSEHVQMVSEVQGITTLTLTSGDVVAIRESPLEAIRHLRGEV